MPAAHRDHPCTAKPVSFVAGFFAADVPGTVPRRRVACRDRCTCLPAALMGFWPFAVLLMHAGHRPVSRTNTPLAVVAPLHPDGFGRGASRAIQCNKCGRSKERLPRLLGFSPWHCVPAVLSAGAAATALGFASSRYSDVPLTRRRGLDPAPATSLRFPFPVPIRSWAWASLGLRRCGPPPSEHIARPSASSRG